MHATFDRFNVMHCSKCMGKLVPKKDLTAMLERLIELVEIPATMQSLPQIEPDPYQLECPKCHDPMEHFGYMGTKQAYIDNCESCKHVWVDQGELTNMCILLAFMYRDQEIRRAHFIDRQNTLKKSVDLSMLTIAIQNSFLLGGALS